MSPVLDPTDGTRRAVALGPLLAVIGREIQERSDALALLLVRRERANEHERALLDFECATHRRELRCTHAEVARLGCRLVASQPMVFRVQAGEGEEGSALFWCT